MVLQEENASKAWSMWLEDPGDVMQKEGNSEATDLPERSNATTGRYAAAVRQLGAELGVTVLDLWTDIQRRKDWRECLNDGLHFTPDGNAVVYELLQATIDEALPHLRCKFCPCRVFCCAQG